jgi:trigger factor
MKIDLKDLSPVRKQMAVEVEADEVAREHSAALRRFASQVRLPGFRQGKAPASLVRTRFAREIEEDVRDRLLARLYREATQEKGLRPLGDPVLENLTHEEGKPFRFETTFEVLPAFTVKGYRDVEARQPRVEVTDEEVAASLAELQRSQSRLVTAEKAAGKGDVLLADVHGTPERTPEGGEPFFRERVLIEVGSEGHLPEFDAALGGAVAGADLEVAATYPADHPAAEMAGKTVRYQIHVHEVKERQVPDLDDAFAKDVGDFPSLEALRGRMREDLEARQREAARAAVRQSVLDKVLLENPVALPEHLVNDEMRHRLEDMVRSLVLQGVDVEKIDLDWKEIGARQEEPARKTVHARLVLDAVAEAEGLSVDAEAVDARLAREAARLGETPAALRRRLQEGAGLEALKIQMLREKTLDFLTSVANIQNEE